MVQKPLSCLSRACAAGGDLDELVVIILYEGVLVNFWFCLFVAVVVMVVVVVVHFIVLWILLAVAVMGDFVSGGIGGCYW